MDTKIIIEYLTFIYSCIIVEHIIKSKYNINFSADNLVDNTSTCWFVSLYFLMNLAYLEFVVE